MLKRVTLFTKPGCHLCENAEATLLDVKSRVDFELEIVNIMADPAVATEYGFDIPVVAVEGVVFSRHHLNRQAFEERVKE